MERKAFGWTGVEVAVIGQGTWRMGESRSARAAEIAALELGLELGETHVDTAELYGDGGAEKVVAEAIAGRRRDDLFVVSKVLPENASRRGTIRAAERSLRRLGVDYLDLYLLHWPGRHPIGETMAAMEDLVRAGKTRYVGVSNFDVGELGEAMAALTGERLACNQVLYSLGARGIERELIPLCGQHGVAVVGYTPFRKGGLPGRGSAGDRVLGEIAARHGATPRQVALRFLTRLPGVFSIPKAVDPAHVRDNAGATGFALDEADVAAIDRAFPAPRGRVPLATS
jgi:diketogulonate reductase-like aldo/keto reductase